MIFHRLGLINKNQKGFTLIEILIAMAITGLIAGGITGAISHVIIGSARSTNHMTAVRQVQDAGYWVSRDAQMAQDITLTEPTGFPLTLDISVDMDPANDYTISYSLDGDKLKRQENGSPETLIAEYIDTDQTTCEFIDTNEDNIDDTLILTITATVGTESETRIYEVIPRPGL